MKFSSRLRRIKDVLANLWQYCKIVKNLYDFDYSSILMVEQNQIKRVRDGIYKERIHSGWNYTVSRMDLAINLLDILLDDGSLVVTDKWEVTKYVNTRNAKRFLTDGAIERINNGYVFLLQDLYKEKAKRLYYKVRERYTEDWWW